MPHEWPSSEISVSVFITQTPVLTADKSYQSLEVPKPGNVGNVAVAMSLNI